MPGRVIGHVAWAVVRRVREASQETPIPAGGAPGRLYVLETVRAEVLDWGHASRLACHAGLTQMLYLLRQRFWWLSIAQDARRHIAACTVCARGKSSHQAPTGFLYPLDLPHRPWSHIAVDFVVGLPESKLQLGATSSLTSGHHPESNGQVERTNQSLESTLRCVTARHPAAWSSWLVWTEYVSSTKGEEAAVPSVQVYIRRCQRIWRQVCAALVRSSQQTQFQANRRRRAALAYVVGQRVWLSTKDLPPQRDSKKLVLRYVGLFEIVGW